MNQPLKQVRRTAAERIGFHLGWDIADVSEMRYQPSRYRIAIYSIGNQYYACPRSEAELPKEWKWEVAERNVYGRDVYRTYNATGGAQ